MMSNVYPMPSVLLENLREIASASANIIMPDPPPSDGEWKNLVNQRQVHLCLQEGEMIGKPVQDEYGNWRFHLSRFGAGVEVYVTAILLIDREEIFVSEVRKEL